MNLRDSIKGECRGVKAIIRNTGGLIQVEFDAITSGFVATPKAARSLANEILEAVKQAEKDDQRSEYRG